MEKLCMVRKITDGMHMKGEEGKYKYNTPKLLAMVILYTYYTARINPTINNKTISLA